MVVGFFGYSGIPSEKTTRVDIVDASILMIKYGLHSFTNQLICIFVVKTHIII